MSVALIIPARYASSRFPGKPLIPLLGKPMILWVAELSARAVGRERVFVATEDNRIASVVREAGFSPIMTSTGALTGTDRLAEAAGLISADIYVNVQGDEPVLDPADIVRVIDEKRRHPEAIINAYCAVNENEDATSVNIPKVVVAEDNRLLYMSRRSVPGFKDASNAPARILKQVCVYAFSGSELGQYAAFGRKSGVEKSEDIELLRVLEWGATVRMVETSGGSLAVDVPEDVPRVEEALRRSWS